MFGQLKAKLVMVESRLRILLVGLEAQTKALRGEIASIDADALALFGRVEAKARAAEGQVSKPLGAARAAVERLAPPR
ncbi:MAG TPA: hypothetical protein VL242_30870 [Sorangium sp.]|uniref:Uncharacterized protein n=1 Tax=Sorangium cellulosum TaxID=56 RepID=A0A150RVW9_SORCE|nr:hypothetical protein BE17_43040 [Sorangium cellulosum]HTN88138.1 hypothetical protein [Sorangium sp.]